MSLSESGNKAQEFEKSWKVSFPRDPVPRLTCFDNAEAAAGGDVQKHSFRSLLQATLDYHDLRISDLQKKLKQQQFILEYVAKELEQTPVPRHSMITTLSNQEAKPTPRPRKPPAVPKKPQVSMSNDDTASHPGAIRRNHSTPSPRQTPTGDKRPQYNSVFIPSSHSIEKNDNDTQRLSGLFEQVVNPLALNSTDSNSADERFETFQGTTFSGGPNHQILQISENIFGSSPTAISNPSAGSPAIIGNHTQSDYESIALSSPSQMSRNSMKKMERVSINDTESSSCSSSPDRTSGDYMQLWTNKPLAQVERNSSSASNGKNAEENVEDSSAASIKSTMSKSGSKKGSRMVRVDYSDKTGGPQPIRDASIENTDQDDDYNSDEEDDKPQYVRLVYKAYSVARFLPPADDTHSINSSGSVDSTDSPAANTGSLSLSEVAEGKTKESANAEGSTFPPPFQTQESTAADESSQVGDGNNNLQMRNWVVNSVLESEKSYIDDLNVLLQYKKSLESAAQSSVPMISLADAALIFGNLQEIHEIHSMFRKNLEPIVAEWTQYSEVGPLFKEMAVNLQHYNTYLENYPKAIATVKKCCQENISFNELVKLIKCPSTQEMYHLEEILHKPINRMQRNSLVLQDLLKCTPPSHPDHKMFQNALKLSQHFLRDQMRISSTGTDKTPLHVLVKNQLLVEYVGGKARKLRHVFLFNDIIVCTKCMIVKGKQHYEVKWYVPLTDIQLSDKMDDTPVEWKQRAAKAEKEIQAMKSKLKDNKAQLRREMKECKDKDIETRTNSRLQRLNKRIQEQEAQLILAEPRLRFTISTKKGTQFCFLLPSDYERREWQESMQSLKAKLPADSTLKITLVDAQSIIDTCRDNVQLNNMCQMVMKEAADEDIVSGQLTVTIHKILGLQNSCETFTAIEIDSFGHFYLKAKTRILESDKPVWNESFAIDLESSSTLRLICYKRTAGGDILLGKSPLNLNKHWLKQGFQEKELSMNEVTLTVSIKYQTAEQTIRRIPSHVETGIFGVKLSNTCNKEGLKVPAFVTACIEDVEIRGIDEMGIYRVSGTTSDVQRIRKAFDKSPRIGKTLLPEVEINAVTGALKLYFRELPEAVVTDALYPNLIEAYKIQNKEEQENKMIALLCSLPDSNYYTMMAVLEHLIRICSHESTNKMPFHNLAVVFGPTLLKPAVKDQSTDAMALFSSGAHDAMYQSGILFYYLTLLSKGTKFR